MMPYFQLLVSDKHDMILSQSSVSHHALKCVGYTGLDWMNEWYEFNANQGNWHGSTD
jgi:hypothetical protein